MMHKIVSSLIFTCPLYVNYCPSYCTRLRLAFGRHTGMEVGLGGFNCLVAVADGGLGECLVAVTVTDGGLEDCLVAVTNGGRGPLLLLFLLERLITSAEHLGQPRGHGVRAGILSRGCFISLAVHE